MALLNIESCPTKGYESAQVAPQPLLSVSRNYYPISILMH